MIESNEYPKQLAWLKIERKRIEEYHKSSKMGNPTLL